MRALLPFLAGLGMALGAALFFHATDAQAQQPAPGKAICTPINPLEDQLSTTVKTEALLNEHLAAGRDHIVAVANGMVLCAW